MRVAPVYECRECPFFDAGAISSRDSYFRNPIKWSDHDGNCYHPPQIDGRGLPRRIEGLSAGQFPDWCELEVMKNA